VLSEERPGGNGQLPKWAIAVSKNVNMGSFLTRQNEPFFLIRDGRRSAHRDKASEADPCKSRGDYL